jgi:hypothetical protein
MVFTVPRGAGKGQEQVASFQVLVGSLQSSEERVLANIMGKPALSLPFPLLDGSAYRDDLCSRVEKSPEAERVNPLLG